MNPSNQQLSMQIMQQLQTTMIGQTLQIREAEQTLAKLQIRDQFLEQLINIARQSTIPYNLRKSAILYSLTYSKHMNSARNLSEERLTQFVKFLFMTLFEDGIQLSLRKHLISTLMYLIGLDKNSRIKCWLYHECVNGLEALLKELEIFGNDTAMMEEVTDLLVKLKNVKIFDKIIHIGLAVQTILLVSIHNTKQLVQFLKKSFLMFCQIAIKLYQIAKQQINKKNKDISRQNILQTFAVIKIYSSSIKLYLKKIQYSDLKTLKLLYQPVYTKLLDLYLWSFILCDNLIDTNLIYHTNNTDTHLVQQFHSIKADFVQILGYTMRSIFQNFRDPTKLSQHETIKTQTLILHLIESLHKSTLISSPHKITSPSLIKLIEQILNCLILAVKSNYYYDLFSQIAVKKHLIEGCIFEFLEFGEPDFERFVGDPEEFLGGVLQVIDMDPTEYVNNRRKENQAMLADQVQQQLQDHTTLRTVCATLLSHYCKNLEGTLSLILQYITSKLAPQKPATQSTPSNRKKQGETKGDSDQQESNYVYIEQAYNQPQDQLSCSLMMVVLAVLRDVVADGVGGKGGGGNVGLVLGLLTDRLVIQPIPAPIKNLNNPSQSQTLANIQHLTLMLTTHKYLTKLKPKTIQSDPQLQHTLHRTIPLLYERICSIIQLKGSEVEKAHKLICYDMIVKVVEFGEMLDRDGDGGRGYCLGFVGIINGMLVDVRERIYDMKGVRTHLYRGEELMQQYWQQQEQQQQQPGQPMQITSKKLQTLYNLYKLHDSKLLQPPPNRSKTVTCTLSSLQTLILLSLKQDHLEQKDQLIKAWNIVKDICDNELFMGEELGEVKICVEGLLVEVVGVGLKVVNGSGGNGGGSVGDWVEVFENVVECFGLLLGHSRGGYIRFHQYRQIFQVIPIIISIKSQKQNIHKLDNLYPPIQQYLTNCSQYLKLFQSHNTLKTIIQISIKNIIVYASKSFDVDSSSTANLQVVQEYHCEGLLVIGNLLVLYGGHLGMEVPYVLAKQLVGMLDICGKVGEKDGRTSQAVVTVLCTNIITCITLILVNGYNSFAQYHRQVLIKYIVNPQYINLFSILGRSLKDKQISKYACPKVMTIYMAQLIHKQCQTAISLNQRLDPTNHQFITQTSTLLDAYLQIAKICIQCSMTKPNARRTGPPIPIGNYPLLPSMYKSRPGMGESEQDRDRIEDGEREGIDCQSEIWKEFVDCLDGMEWVEGVGMGIVQNTDQIAYVKQKLAQLCHLIGSNQSGKGSQQIDIQQNMEHRQKTVWQTIIESLSEQSRAYIKKMLAIVKINNENRQIFKIKK